MIDPIISSSVFSWAAIWQPRPSRCWETGHGHFQSRWPACQLRCGRTSLRVSSEFLAKI